MGRILGPQDLSSVENMNDAQPTKMGKLRKILSGLSDIDSLVNSQIIKNYSFLQSTLQEMCWWFLLSREMWYRKSVLPGTGAG